MAKKIILVFTLIFAVGFLVFSTDSQAMPNFARKLNADCTMCHTQVPKLNRIGYEFRLAGYRLPSEIGKEEKPFNLAEFFAARFQAQYRWEQVRQDGKKSTTDSQLEFVEFTFYPLTGSWGKYFASLGEFSMAPDEEFEIENAYVRGVYGNDKGFFQGRIGVFHPFEGFGGSDRPLGVNRPLFQKLRATNTAFFIWNPDEMGVEAGYYFGGTGTSIAVDLLNGIKWKEDGSTGEPAQGGGLSKDPGPGHNDKDVRIFVNQFITDDSAVSLDFYRGVVGFPKPGLSDELSTRDEFWRASLYANFWPVKDCVNLLAGGEYGDDSIDNNSATGAGSVGHDYGFFGEVDYHPTLPIPGKLAVGARYDYFDPSTEVDHNTVQAGSIFANWYVWNGFQLLGDYRHREDQITHNGGTKKDDLILARMVFIW